jgi:metal-sulfur cluster biosynthetic enzyme
VTTTLRPSTTADIVGALTAVTDPVLDEPITGLGLVHSLTIDDDAVFVRLRVPADFFPSDTAYLMVSECVDALRNIEDIGRVSIVIDDHPDSDAINAVTAAGTEYRGLGAFLTAGHVETEALREEFLHRAHSAAVLRSLAAHLAHADEAMDCAESLTLRDLRGQKHTTVLLRRRSALGLSICPNSRVLVDHHGSPIATEQLSSKLRSAISLRLSEGSRSYFRRALLTSLVGNHKESVTEPHVTDLRTRTT